MPFLKHVLNNATGKELRMLRGKTIECISLIGLAVGAEKVHSLTCDSKKMLNLQFQNDAQEIMNVLLSSQQELSSMEADDPQVCGA